MGAEIDKFIDSLEEIFADIRERHIDDSVCGLCEYDGAYVGQSGDWFNECPGFEKDDCFKLSDKTRKEWTEEIIKALPSVEPEITEDDVKEYCRKRCLIVVTSDFYDEMMSRWSSAQPEPEPTMEEFMYGQDLGSPEDGSL